MVEALDINRRKEIITIIVLTFPLLDICCIINALKKKRMIVILTNDLLECSFSNVVTKCGD